MRSIETSTGKAQALTGEISMVPSVLLCLHEYALVVTNCFMFRGGLALEERLRRGLRLYQRSEENDFSRTKDF